MSHKHQGFTIVELLVVVLILGILAAVALPKFSGTRDKAKLAAIRSDVRNAETAEESYFSDNGRYATMSQLLNNGLTVSTGIELRIDIAAGGYTVRASDASIQSAVKGCSVRVGGRVAMTSDGVITCP